MTLIDRTIDKKQHPRRDEANQMFRADAIMEEILKIKERMKKQTSYHLRKRLERLQAEYDSLTKFPWEMN